MVGGGAERPTRQQIGEYLQSSSLFLIENNMCMTAFPFRNIPEILAVPYKTPLIDIYSF